MAKCLMCNAVKGKRKCQIVDGLICSLCCGTTRNEEQCQGCEFYKSPQESRKYTQIPYFSPQEMEADFELQEISETIESAFCRIDATSNFQLADEVPKHILEKLLDLYHYEDKELTFQSERMKDYFNYVHNAMQEQEIDEIDKQTLVKVIKAIHFILVRRTTGHREYFKVIHKYVGPLDGIRII